MEPSFTENMNGSMSSVVAHVGNLRSDIAEESLKENLMSFFEASGISLHGKDIAVHRKSRKKPAYCFVTLKDKATFDFTCEKLNGTEYLEGNTVVYPGKRMKVSVGRRNPLHFAKLEPIPNNTSKTRRSRKAKHKNSLDKIHAGINHSVTMETKPIERMVPGGSVTMDTNSDAMNVTPDYKQQGYQNVLGNDKLCHNVAISNCSGTQSNKDHGPIHYSSTDEGYFYVGQKLGTEDRLTEYKQGGGNFLDLHFKTVVGKYVCAFLNSEGGTLLIGVTDDCFVCGVSVPRHKEDQLRLDIDKVMKGISPPVFPNSYSLQFIPVYASSSTNDDNLMKNTLQKGIKNDLKVIKVIVHPHFHKSGVPQTDLYENEKGEVYIRRDGSIQGLKASEIIAWNKQNMKEGDNLEKNHLQQEIKRKQGEIEMNLKLVDEMVKQKQFLEDQYQEKIEKLKENEAKLNEEITILKRKEETLQGEMAKIKQNRSKVCNIL